MLDHSKPYVEKIHYIDLELAGHVGYINVKWNGKVCVGVAFFCLLCACLPSPTTLEWIDQQYFAKTKMGYISLPSDLNAILIGITSYCLILKMVILHDAIKQFRIGFLYFFWKKNENLFLFKKTKKRLKKTCELLFWNPFFSILIIFQSFFVIFLWSHDLEQVTSLSVWLGVRRTPKA